MSDIDSSSLFQRSGNLMPNFSQPNDVENDAEEDKRRMNEELSDILKNAFDDVTDDDDDDDDVCVSDYDDRSHIASNSSNFTFIKEEGDAALPKLHQLSDNGLPNENNPTNDDIAVLETALTTVLSMGNSTKNRYASHLANHLPIVQEDGDVIFESQEFLQADDASISDHYLHCYRSSPAGYENHKEISEQCQPVNENELYREASYCSMEQLQVLYDVRVREVQRLMQQLQESHEFAAKEKEKHCRELMLSEADKERAKCLHREAEKQLFSSMKKIEVLEKQVETLKFSISSLESSNTQLKQDFESSQVSNMDLHQKLLLLERSSLSGSTKQLDSFIKNCQKKHEQEVQVLKNEVAVVSEKLKNKEADCARLEQRVVDLARTQEAMVLEKAETVNQMAAKLEESQRQYQHLMETTVGQDNVMLTSQLSVISQEKEHLDNKLQEMKKEVESLKFDLHRYENAVHLGILNGEDSLATDSMIQLGIAQTYNNNHTKFPRSEEMNLHTNLRDEFRRCLLGKKMKNDEIKRLKLELEKKDQIIKKLKQNEEKYLDGVEKFKEDVGKLMTQLKVQDELTREIESFKKKNEDILQQLRHSESEVSRVNNELECIKKARDELESENTQLRHNIDKMTTESENKTAHGLEYFSKEYLHFHDEAIAKVKEDSCKETESRVAEVSIQLEHSLKELQDVKLQYIHICSTKENLLEQLRKEKETIVELTSELLAKKEELTKVSEALKVQQKLSDKLSDELKNSQEKVSSLSHTLESEQIRLKEQCMIIKEMEDDKEQLLKNIDNKVKQLYTAKVTEEINAAKEQLLKEVECSCKKKEYDYNIRIEQLYNTCSLLQEKVKDYDEKCIEAERCRKYIEELQTELQQHKFLIDQLRMKENLKPEQNLAAEAIRSSFKDVSTSRLSSAAEEVEANRAECAILHAAELEALQLTHQAEMEEQQEKIRQETVNYFANLILSIETNHKLNVQESGAATANELLFLQDTAAGKVHVLPNAVKQVMADERLNFQTVSDDTCKEKIDVLTEESAGVKSTVKRHSFSEQEKQIAAFKFLLQLKEKQLVEVRENVSELVAKCTREAQFLRKSNDELGIKYAECLMKYNAAKMKAAKYKKSADEKAKQLTKEYERIRDGYENALSTIQKKAEETFRNKESTIATQVIELEKKIQQLKQKQARYEVA